MIVLLQLALHTYIGRIFFSPKKNIESLQLGATLGPTTATEEHLLHSSPFLGPDSLQWGIGSRFANEKGTCKYKRVVARPKSLHKSGSCFLPQALCRLASPTLQRASRALFKPSKIGDIKKGSRNRSTKCFGSRASINQSQITRVISLRKKAFLEPP